MSEKIGNENEMSAFLHCGKCLKELPAGKSPSEWARLSVGWTPRGLQVWCSRHDCNVMHVDFEGAQHPANLTCNVPDKALELSSKVPN